MSAYTKVNADWKDYPDTTTPLTAAGLEQIETGISDAHTELETKASTADAILKTIVDAKGDLIVGTAADTVARLAKGTTGQVLSVSADSSLYWADSSTATGSFVRWEPIQLRNPQQAANPGNTFPQVSSLTDWEMWYWEFLKDVDGKVFGTVIVPAGIASTAGDIVLAVAANATSGVTRLQVGHKAVADGESLNPTMTDITAQDITVPGTAYLRKDVTFAVTESLAGGDLLLVEVYHNGAHVNDTLAVSTLLLGAWLKVTVNA